MADLFYQRVIRTQREQARPSIQQRSAIPCPYCPSRLSKRLYEKEEQLLGHVREAHEGQDVNISEIRELVKSRGERDAKRFKSSKVTTAARRRSESDHSKNSTTNHVEGGKGESSNRQDDKAAVRSAKKLGELSLSSDEKRQPTSRDGGSWKERKRGGRRPQSSSKGYAQTQQNAKTYSSGLEEGYNSELVSHRGTNPLRQVRSQHGKLFDPAADDFSTAKSPNLMQRPVLNSHGHAQSSTQVRAFSPGIIPVPRENSLIQILASQARPHIHPDDSMSPSVVQINDIDDTVAVDPTQHVIKNEEHDACFTHNNSTMEQKDRPKPGLPESEPFKQPVPREIPEEALNAEVKMIYTGLCHIETKCRTVDQAQGHRPSDGDSAQQRELTSDHWRALIALHRTLLNEHHDFFLASQHPSASPALRRLASRYSMPARLWRHGIHSFLEVLRHRLPESLEYMLAFIYLAYQMMSLLYETVPAFESTWIECLGDLGRYRMAIEDVDMRDREVWNNVARYWYAKAADRNPHVGRLYHHLAILARSDPLQQIYLYSRSLISVECFHSARESIRTLLDPVTNNHPSYSKALAIDRAFIKMIAILFDKRNVQDFDRHKAEFLQHVGRSMDQVHWKDRGVYVLVSIIGAILDFGSGKSALQQAYKHSGQKSTPSNAEEQGVESRSSGDPKSDPDSKEIDHMPEDSPYKISLVKACELLSELVRVTIKRYDDEKTFPSLHVLCVFLSSLLRIRDDRSTSTVKLIYCYIPWNGLARSLDLISLKEKIKPGDSPFKRQGKDGDVPLPEDYLIRDQLWCQDYHPDGWFENAGLDEEERKLELSSTAKSRIHRILSVHRLLKMQCSKFEQTMAENGDVLAMKEAADVEMLDVSNQLSTEQRPGVRAEDSTDFNSKPFKLMKRDAAGLSGSAIHTSEKSSDHSMGEKVLIDDDGLLLEERESFTFTAASDAKGAATVTTDITAKLPAGEEQ